MKQPFEWGKTGKTIFIRLFVFPHRKRKECIKDVFIGFEGKQIDFDINNNGMVSIKRINLLKFLCYIFVFQQFYC